MKILEAGKKARRMFNFIHRAYNTPEEMEDYLSEIALDRSVVRTWQNIIDNIRIHGVRNLVATKNKVCFDAALDEGTLETITDENDAEPWLIPIIKYAYKATFREQWNAQINTWDAVSRIGTLAEIGDTDFADDWPFDANPLTEWAHIKGNNGCIYGGVKRGKTNFALRLSEYFLKEGWIIVSNIPVKSPPHDYHYTPTLSMMLAEICKARLAGKHVLILMDEGAIFWIKMDTIQAQNKALGKIILTLGKLDSNLLYVGHRQKDIPDIVVWTSVASFEKTAHKTVFMDIDEGIRIRSKVFTSVPATTFDYDPSKMQNFEVDIDVGELFKYMSKLAEDENQWEAMLGYLDQHEGELKEGGEVRRRRMVAQFLKEEHPGFSVRDIAQLVGTSASTAHDYISKTTERKE